MISTILISILALFYFAGVAVGLYIGFSHGKVRGKDVAVAVLKDWEARHVIVKGPNWEQA